MMSKQNQYYNEEETALNPILSTCRKPNTFRPGNHPLVKTMTIDRNKPKINVTDVNPYGTMPRQRPNASPYAMIKSITAFSNIFATNDEANTIAEEELAYLKAVEAGELVQVQNILSSALLDSFNCSEKTEHGKQNGAQASKKGALANASSKAHFRKHGHPSAPLIDAEVTASGKILDSATHSSVDDKSQPRKFPPVRRRSSFTLWQKPPTQVPLPVSLTNANPVVTRNKKPLHIIPNQGKSKFNKNCRDQWGRSALFIAMIHYNMEMIELLLRHKVEIKECLYHAIDFGYYDVVDLFMQYDTDKSQMITEEDSFYLPGLTPFQLAAHKNDYVMLKILYAHGYRIPKEWNKSAFSKKWSSCDTVGRPHASQPHLVLDQAWDRSNHQILFYKAVASPAYLVMTFLEGLENDAEHNWDFLESIFNLYAHLKKKASEEPTVRSLYTPLADQVEDFACDLLDEVRCSTDLVDLLRFDPQGQPHSTGQRPCLAPVQRAIDVRMKRFVAHENSQLAISTLRLGTVFDSGCGWETCKTRLLLACVYPFLCIVFTIAPDSKIGNLLKNPIVNMTCHVTSEMIFLCLMIFRLILLTKIYDCDCLGLRVYSVDWVLLLFVIGRTVKQVNTIRDMDFKSIFSNVWMLNDLGSTFLFFVVIVLKIYDVSAYNVVSPRECLLTRNESLSQHFTLDDHNETKAHQCDRTTWSHAEALPVTISEAALAVIYLLICVRAMEILYTDRTFGPLQLSLDKMLLDTLRFLTIFTVTFSAFAFAMTQLYWAWGRPRLNQLSGDIGICGQDHDYSSTDCYPVYSYIGYSFLEQYWTLYGYGWGDEPPAATTIPSANKSNKAGYKGVTPVVGQAVSMIFHVWSVVVMLNMLVAMMSHSFDRVRNNAELEWKFHRSEMWMKFIRRGVHPKPPPMNLIPSVRDVKRFFIFLRKTIKKCRHRTPVRLNARHEAIKTSATKPDNLKYRQAITNITQRYLRRRLLPDFNHGEVDQAVNRANTPRRSSTVLDDISGVIT